MGFSLPYSSILAPNSIIDPFLESPVFFLRKSPWDIALWKMDWQRRKNLPSRILRENHVLEPPYSSRE
jgi:hypothetical protein